MKKLLLFIPLFIVLSTSFSQPIRDSRITSITSEYRYEEFPMDFLVNSMIYVESKWDSTAIGDGGRAVGVLQIHKIMVREVNRITHMRGGDSTIYYYDDRYSVKKSIEMFHIWRNYYHPNSSYETIARCWNGGPRGNNCIQTKRYWYKVREELNGIIYYNLTDI
tara:strand:+ start:30 stop:521 length:492 start_codon:yes stop_codon:yes gene_type:complete